MISLRVRAPWMTLSAVAVALATSGAGGCGGGGGTQRYPDAVAPAGSGGRAANADGGAATGGGAGGRGVDPADAGGGTTTDGGAPAPGSVRLITGPSAILSPGTACSAPVMAAGGTRPDQWCGVFRPGATAGTVSLAVFNLTKALAGTLPTCAAGDANCLVLSPNVTADGQHGFFGETLIYYQAQSVSAWRPGWTAGRVLVTQDQPADCIASTTGALPAALCFKNTVDPAIANLYAGRIDTQAGPVLTLVEGISGPTASANFSADAQSVLWSTQTSTTVPEILKMQTIGDATTRRTVASNVTSWSQTPDGTHWLWVSQPITDATGLTSGVLQTSLYPAGTAPKDVQAAVIQYASFTDKGIVVLANPGDTGADLKTITDIDSPTTTAHTIESQSVVNFSALSLGGAVVYSTDFVQPNPTTDPSFALVNLVATKVDGTGKCAVTAALNADPNATFARGNTAVTWARVDNTGTTAEAMLTSLTNCATQVLATALAGFSDVGQGVLIQQNANAQTFTAALNYVPFTGPEAIGAIVAIHPAANVTVAPLFPYSPRVLYTVNQATTSGVYVSAALPGALLAFIDPPTAAFVSTGAGASSGGARVRARLASAGIAPRLLAARARSMPVAVGGGLRAPWSGSQRTRPAATPPLLPSPWR